LGAIDHRTNRVFLRLWDDKLKPGEERRVVIYRKEKPAYEKSRGYPERAKHVEAIKNGAQGFGVICRARDRQEKPRAIAGFEKDALVRLSALSEDPHSVSAQITWMPINELQFSGPVKRKTTKSNRQPVG
jgi:hypothetical protein